ncbi:MAG: hypothetical protein AAF740_13420, partial [Bacteroidota bacterium]
KALSAAKKYVRILGKEQSRARNYKLAKAEYRLEREREQAQTEALRQQQAAKHERELIRTQFRQYVGLAIILGLVLWLCC